MRQPQQEEINDTSPGSGTAHPDRARRRRNLFILIFLAVQLTLPIRGFVRPKLETRGNFSWNMYSQQYSCQARYVLLTPDGRGLWVDHREYSRVPERISAVFRSDWLPDFNDWLCAELRREAKYGRLKARIRCQHNFGPQVELAEPYEEICEISEPEGRT